MSKLTFKKIGLSILLLPLGFLLFFTFGEVFSGDRGGFSHILQIAPLLFLTFLAWKKPFLGGAFLIAASIFFGVWYVLNVSFPLQTILIVEFFLFLPPFVAGMLFLLSSDKIEQLTG